MTDFSARSSTCVTWPPHEVNQVPLCVPDGWSVTNERGSSKSGHECFAVS